MESATVSATGEIEAPVACFVRTLFSLCSAPTDATLIAWSTDGTRIVVCDTERFSAETCPKFFRHSNWSSFTRVLNMYQFTKCAPDVPNQTLVEFKHPLFFRGGDAMLNRISRKKSKPRAKSKCLPRRAKRLTKVARPSMIVPRSEVTAPPKVAAGAHAPAAGGARAPPVPGIPSTSMPSAVEIELRAWLGEIQEELATLRAEIDRLRKAADRNRKRAPSASSPPSRKRILSNGLSGISAGGPARAPFGEAPASFFEPYDLPAVWGCGGCDDAAGPLQESAVGDFF